MRWNCPHCGVTLAIGEDKISGGWSFSRCYKCGGHALVRRAEINVIKVDRAPPGERVLLPEASENPRVGLNQEAAQNFARASAQAQASQSAANATAAALMAAAGIAESGSANAIPGIPSGISSAIPAMAGMPSMEVRGHSTRAQSRMLPAAMGLAGAMAIGSGIYLYIQGQNLWNRATRVASRERVRDVSRDLSRNDNDSEQVATSQSAPSVSIGRDIVREAREAREARDGRDSGMNAISEAAGMIASQNRAESANNNNSASVSGAISTELLIRVKSPSTRVRTGPGIAFPLTGTANPALSYKVVEWKDRWFRIADMTDGRSLGWVRNDQVETQGR